MDDATEMPRGAMTEGPSSPRSADDEGQMPRGLMTARGTPAGETAGGEMPGGHMGGGPGGGMSAGEASGGEMPGGSMVEPGGLGSVQAIEIPGLWRVTLSKVQG